MSGMKKIKKSVSCLQVSNQSGYTRLGCGTQEHDGKDRVCVERVQKKELEGWNFSGGKRAQRDCGERRRPNVPHEEDDLGARSIGSGVVVELEDGVTAVISGELTEELRVGSRRVTSLQKSDGLVVGGETEDHVSVLSTELEVVELRDDGLVDSDTSRLHKESHRV